MTRILLRGAAVMPPILVLCLVGYKAYGLPHWGIGPLSFGLMAAALLYLAAYALTRSDSGSDAKFAVAAWSTLICAVGARFILSEASRMAAGSQQPQELAQMVGEQHPDWWVEYTKEFAESSQLQWRSYNYWRRLAYTGNLINIDAAGRRKTWNAAPEEEATTIHMFGGSTLWGNGSRDDYTIPSLVSRSLSERGHRVHVSNHGELGYVMRQSLLELIIELQTGPAPDIVVFYDGVNDVFSSFQNREAGIPQNEATRQVWFNQMTTDRLLQQYGLQRLPAPPNSPQVDDELLADDTVRVYLATVKTVESLAAAYGFEVFYYWQPMIYLDKPLTPYEQKINTAHRPEMGHFYQNAYGRVRAQLPFRHFRDLSQIFSNVPDELYLDFCHINEKGNGIVAQEIANDLDLALAERARIHAPETAGVGRL